MTRDETVALFLECEARRAEARAAALAENKGEDEAEDIAHDAAKAHWNAWAEGLLAQRKAMEAAGSWALEVETDVRGFPVPKNDETRAWVKNATADFSRCLFLVQGAEVGSKEIQSGEQPIKSIQLEELRAGFRGFIFPGPANFRSAFSGLAYFRSATFFGPAFFLSANFISYANFRKATFIGPAIFDSATFQNSVSFEDAKFQKGANFEGIKTQRAIGMTNVEFKQVPAFNLADLNQAPDLDAVSFPLPAFWRGGNAGLIPRYRAIRRMAFQGADYEREQMAFKGETRSKRGTEHKPWHTAFWFGIAYDALSDYGRSIARPLGIWLASALAFAAIYAWNAGVAVSGWLSACADDGASKALRALTLSAANSLPLIGSSRGEVAREFYTECLALPHAPAWSPILQIWQTLWSAVLLFLFLLALRNQFKIK